MTRRTYLPGEEGQAAYQARAARDTTPRGDPQRAAGWRDPREYAAEVMARCVARTGGGWACGPGGQCRATLAEHGTQADLGEGRHCSISIRDDHCRCPGFNPGKPHDYGPDQTEVACRACELDHFLDAETLCPGNSSVPLTTFGPRRGD